MNHGTQLNLGCGRMPLPGWTNVDKYPAEGVDMVLDLEKVPWPWATASVLEIRADRLFNHLRNWEDALLECARILLPGGRAVVKVHNGLRPVAFLPYEMRFFDDHTFDMFADNTRQKTCIPFVSRPLAVQTLERPLPFFSLMSTERFHEAFPFSWHLAQRLGPRVYRWPLGRCTDIRFVFRRNETPWSSRT